MSEGDEGLWCCERSSAAVDMPCCCDCQAIDQICDRCCRCQGVNLTEVDSFFTSMEDRCRFPSCRGGGAIQVRLDLVTPLLMIPCGLIFGSFGTYQTALTLGAFAASLLLYYRVWKHRPKRVKTKFFYTWCLTSCIFLYYLFEIIVLLFREVLFWENVVLSMLFGGTMICLYMTRHSPGTIQHNLLGGKDRGKEEIVNGVNGSPRHKRPDTNTKQGGVYGHSRAASPNSHEIQINSESDDRVWCEDCQKNTPPRAAHCPVCATCVLTRDHHCIWLNNCIGEQNHRPFLLGLLLAVMTGCYGSHLMLTTVCTPEMYYDWFLLPADCRFVYNSFLSALGYVGCLYTLCAVTCLCPMILYQLILISQNITSQELHRAAGQGQVFLGLWVRKNTLSRGFLKNWKMFLHGRRRIHTYQDQYT